jgi:streptogramin lyase
MPVATRHLLFLLASSLLGCGARSPLDDASSVTDGRITNPAPSGPPRHFYVSDTHGAQDQKARLVRFDDFTGAGWTTFSGGGLSLSGMSGVAVDAAGHIYLTRAAFPQLLRMDDMTGAGLVTFGEAGTDEGQFVGAGQVALDAQGRIYVTDFPAHRIVRFDDMFGAGWETLGGPDPGSGPGELDSPISIAVSPRGKILISDFKTGRVIQVDDMSGAGWSEWKLPDGPVGNAAPSGVAYDAEDRIYVVDFENFVLHRLDSIAGDGLFTFSNPKLIQLGSVFVDGTGRILLVSTNAANAVSAMDDMTGTNLVTLGGPFGTGVGEFENPDTIYAR